MCTKNEVSDSGSGIVDIENAKGKFTEVKSIQYIYGTHFSMGVHAGVARSEEARALFRKYIAGGGAGIGREYNLGRSSSGLTIKP